MLDKVTPNFIRRLDAYQRIRSEQENNTLWVFEKQILIFAAIDNQHKGSAWRLDDIRKYLESNIGGTIKNEDVIPVIQSLKDKELARGEGREDINHFSPEAELMGYVLNSLDKNTWNKYMYATATWSVYILIFAGALTAIFAMLNQAIEFFKNL